MTDSSSPNSIPFEVNRMNAKRFFRSAFLIALIVIVVTLGYSLFRFRSPEYREFKLDLKNGYTLVGASPSDWRASEEKDFTNNTEGISQSDTYDSNIICLKRSKPSWAHAWWENYLQRDVANMNSPLEIDVSCWITPLVGNQNVENYRAMDYYTVQKSNETFDRNSRDISTLELADNQLGLLLKMTTTQKIPAHRSVGYKHNMYKSPHTFVYSCSPDKKQSIKIFVSENSPVGLDSVVAPVLEEVTKSLRLVPTVK